MVAPSQCPSEAVDRPSGRGPQRGVRELERGRFLLRSLCREGGKKCRLASRSLALLPAKSGASFPSLSLTHSLTRTGGAEARNAAALRFAGGVGINFPSEMSDIKTLALPVLSRRVHNL